MEKKVLLIDGSARKRNTYSLLTQVGAMLQSRGIKTEIINLFDYTIEDCVGCEACVTQKTCAIDDDMPKIRKMILESDGVVMSSPVYMSGVTSKFKTFTDRSNIWIHKPETAGKPVMFLTTTASTGIKATKQFFNTFANGIGARKGGFISRTVKEIKRPISEQEMAGFIKLLGQEREQYHPDMGEIVMFAVGKVLALKSQGDDRKFWEDKGWLDKRYYFPCKMNPFKKLFSGFIFKVISNAMK